MELGKSMFRKQIDATRLRFEYQLADLFSSHLISSYNISSYLISSHAISSQTMPCHVIPCYAMPSHPSQVEPRQGSPHFFTGSTLKRQFHHIHSAGQKQRLSLHIEGVLLLHTALNIRRRDRLHDRSRLHLIGRQSRYETWATWTSRAMSGKTIEVHPGTLAHLLENPGDPTDT